MSIYLGELLIQPWAKTKHANTIGNTGKPDYWIFRISPSGSVVKQDIHNPLLQVARLKL
jgi:hypothetical protein